MLFNIMSVCDSGPGTSWSDEDCLWCWSHDCIVKVICM